MIKDMPNYCFLNLNNKTNFAYCRELLALNMLADLVITFLASLMIYILITKISKKKFYTSQMKPLLDQTNDKSLKL